MDNDVKRLFPKGFLWGASTASHQVEGMTNNQWTKWEHENASRLAATAKQRLDWLPKWSEISENASTPSNYISADAVQHYTRYKDDFTLLKKLRMNSLRFGIEWSRVEPEEGKWDDREWQHYRDYIQTLISMDIEPILNIWHWTMPVWFTVMGGFEKRANIQFFERFVAKLCEELPIQQLRYILTLNEPNVYASFGYITGEWPPGVRKRISFLKVYFNLVVAHRRAYSVLKNANPHIRVGLAGQMANIQAKRPQNLFDMIATRWMRYFWNWWFYNRCRNYQDFVGINYYFTDYYRWGDYKHIKNHELFFRANPNEPKNDLGWYMEPEGIYPLMVRAWAHYKKPIMITENGLADAEDTYRRWWIEETIVAMERAISEGIDVIGYMHWSLLDNFEWAYGWWPKFGLIAVDRTTQERTIRPSATFYADKIQELSH